jgi:uncharacterized membrane protein
MKRRTFSKDTYAALFLLLLFCIAYTTLALVRHHHFGSFGFDLGISDQIVWKYSQFKSPTMTIIAYNETNALTDHFEPLYILLAPLYWIYSSPVVLLIAQTVLVCLSGLPVYLLAKQKNLPLLWRFVLLFAYMTFYGIQHALWFDVHTVVFGAAFLPWFIYCIDSKRYKLAILPFILALLAKEDMGLILSVISFTLVLFQKDEKLLVFAGSAVVYTILVLFVYFPYFTQDGYRYAGSGGFFDSLHVANLYNTAEKRSVYLYSFAWFGFLPLLTPLSLFPFFADITKYFVVANNLPATHGLFMHYRSALAILLVWPSILTLSRAKKLHHPLAACVVLLGILYLNYSLHVPLTYLTKKWFWTSPSSLISINTVIKQIQPDYSIAVQNNLVSHLSQRDHIYTLWYEQKKDEEQKICGETNCDWLRWNGAPDYLFVDIAPEWDIRHFLSDREKFTNALTNLEKAGIISIHVEMGTTKLYRIKNK